MSWRYSEDEESPLLESLESPKKLEDWKLEWAKVVQIKKTVRPRTGSYTITIMISREFNDKTVEILNALKELLK